MRKLIAMSVLSLCVIVVAWFYHDSVEDHGARSVSQVRQIMVQRQHVAQQLARLNDGISSPLLRVLGEDISAVQIRIAEYLKGINSNFGENQLMYEQSLLIHQLSTDTLEDTIETPIKSVRILRLDVQILLAHAQQFLTLLQDINFEIGGWPIEVRACDLQKTPPQNLVVRCVMDIYYWSTDADESAKVTKD